MNSSCRDMLRPWVGILDPWTGYLVFPTPALFPVSLKTRAFGWRASCSPVPRSRFKRKNEYLYLHPSYLHRSIGVRFVIDWGPNSFFSLCTGHGQKKRVQATPRANCWTVGQPHALRPLRKLVLGTQSSDRATLGHAGVSTGWVGS